MNTIQLKFRKTAPGANEYFATCFHGNVKNGAEKNFLITVQEGIKICLLALET